MLQSMFKLYYELNFNKKNSNNYLNTTILYIIIILLFPVSLHYDLNILYSISIPTIYVSYFLIILLILDNIFTEEKNYGHLIEYYFLRNYQLYWLIVIKICIRWVYISITLSLGVFAAFILFNVEFIYYFNTIMVLVVITPILLFIGSINAALLVGLKDKGILISLLTLPFYIPILIYSINILQSNIEGSFVFNNYMAFILFFGILIILAPRIIIYALKTWSD